MLAAAQFSKYCSIFPPLGDGDTSLDWVGTLDTAPAEFGITSVWTTNVSFNRFSFGDKTEKKKPQYLCPGSPISFTQYVVADRRQKRVIIDGVPLGVFLPRPVDIDYDP